jgi:pimeloyl-ACP methyl ester carboxylesterase
VSGPLIAKAMLTFKDPKFYLFFTASKTSRRAASAFLARLKERQVDRDKPITIAAFLRQLTAIHAWGRQAPQDLGAIRHPVLVANGDHDIMVPSRNSVDLAKRLSNAELVLYEDAGHGGIFQYHEAFVPRRWPSWTREAARPSARRPYFTRSALIPSLASCACRLSGPARWPAPTATKLTPEPASLAFSWLAQSWFRPTSSSL